MTTLRIEHAITDFAVWNTAFDRFADVRLNAGVRGHRVQRPIDDARYVLIDLDFDSVGEAERFLALLRANVWTNTQSSPGLAGEPSTRILEPA